VLTALRNAKKPLTTQDIAQQGHGGARAGYGQRAASKDDDEAGGSLPARLAEAGRRRP
jgi:hypothetical protein